MKASTFDTLVFDTLACKNRLMSKGLSEPHAEAITEEIKHTHEVNLQNLATKSDLMLCKNELMAEIKQLELRMTIKLGGMLIIIAGLTLTVAKFMFGNA